MQCLGAMKTCMNVCRVFIKNLWFLKSKIRILFQEFDFQVSTIEMEDSRIQKELGMAIVYFKMRTRFIFTICIIPSKIDNSNLFPNLSTDRGKIFFMETKNNKIMVFKLLICMIKIEFLIEWNLFKESFLKGLNFLIFLYIDQDWKFIFFIHI